jgi:Protein of unknown function (DUF5661)
MPSKRQSRVVEASVEEEEHEDQLDDGAYQFITKKQARYYYNKYKINPDAVPLEQFHRGMAVEMEHGVQFANFPDLTDVTDDSLDKSCKIAIAHFSENPRYYIFLADMEKRADKYWKTRTMPKLFRE